MDYVEFMRSMESVKGVALVFSIYCQGGLLSNMGDREMTLVMEEMGPILLSKHLSEDFIYHLIFLIRKFRYIFLMSSDLISSSFSWSLTSPSLVDMMVKGVTTSGKGSNAAFFLHHLTSKPSLTKEVYEALVEVFAEARTFNENAEVFWYVWF